ncbi:MAG: GntR family transcriptional regulator [Verrucomicrobiales bacterium]|nr:GntR family transcriptional regulator [Verrucomicrobiales bacterium]
MHATAITPSNRSASKAKVVRGLLEGLLEGKWQGGNRFTETLGAEAFGVSRTPVREALLDLQALGLIELRRNCGAIIHPFGENDLREIYAVRSLFEVEATRVAASRINLAKVETLIEAFEKIRGSGGIDPEWEFDRGLHQLIADSSGNRRLSTEIGRYSSLVQTMREIVGARAQGIHSASADEHLEILRALHRRDASDASSAMRDHLQQASDSAVAAMLEIRQR